MKAEAKWTIPGTLKWPESTKDSSCLPLFNAEGDEQIQFRFEIHLRKSLFCSLEADPDQLRVKLFLVKLPSSLKNIAAKCSIIISDNNKDGRVVYQQFNLVHKVLGASNYLDEDLTEFLNLGKPDKFLEQSDVSLRCIVDYYKNVQEFQKFNSIYSSISGSNGAEDFRNSSLIRDLKKIFTDDHSTSNICFVVNGQEIKAHNSIVSARSPVFAAMFGAEMDEKRIHRAVIQGIETDVFKSLLLFLYTDQVELTKNNGVDLLAAANQYSIPLLKTKCEEFLYTQNLTTKNCAERILLADLHNAPHLMQKAEDFLRFGRQNEVMKTEGWKKLKQFRPELAFQVLENILAGLSP